MNNPLNLQWQTISVNMPAETMINVEQLIALRQQNEAMKTLEEKIAQAYDKLDIDTQQRTQQTEEAIAVMISQAKEKIAELKIEQRDQVVREAVTWLCEEHQLEKVIAGELNRRWRTYTARALETLFKESDQKTLLLQRIEREVAASMLDDRIMLAVSAEDYQAVNEAWSDIELVTIKRDSSLTAGQAVLDNGLIRIHLDLPSQQAEILSQLRLTTKEKNRHGEN